MLPDGLIMFALRNGCDDFVRRHVVGAQPVGLHVDDDAARAAAERRRRRHAGQRGEQRAHAVQRQRPASRRPFAVSLEKTRLPTGTLPASNRMTNGGTVPGGMNARARFT